MLKPNAFQNFGGLVLNQPLDGVGGEQAIDLLDVDWGGSLGTLRSRGGASAFTGAAATNYNVLFPHSLIRLLARRAATLYAINEAGNEIAGKSIVVPENKHLAFAKLGTPSASYTYIADQENTLKRYDGTDFTSPTCTVAGAKGVAMPKGKYLCVWPDGGNRLVIAGTTGAGGPAGAISSGSHVWFSMPGNAEEYEGTAYVQLTPGDGEEITGCVCWGGMVFVFKETKCFIFFGVSADQEGKPIFNFRTMDLGTRITAPASFAGEKAVVGNDSVYFVADDGVYATTGGEPSLLSTDLEPLAKSQPLVGPVLITLGERRWVDAEGIAYMNECIYVGLVSGGVVDRVMKYDLRKQGWTILSASLNAMVGWVEQTNTRGRVFFSGSGAGNKKIFFYTTAVDTDASVTMDPRWQSGFYDLEDADEKTLTNMKVWGTGEVTVKVAEDYKEIGTGTKFKLGTSPKIAQRQLKKSQTATLFSHQISGTAPWSVQRIDRYLRETRVPATKKKG
ncbi:MAG TPA: hypothetical protein VF245_12740 [Solirubrobacterales bacterium]